jgi:hypothetical protein
LEEIFEENELEEINQTLSFFSRRRGLLLMLLIKSPLHTKDKTTHSQEQSLSPCNRNGTYCSHTYHKSKVYLRQRPKYIWHNIPIDFLLELTLVLQIFPLQTFVKEVLLLILFYWNH